MKTPQIPAPWTRAIGTALLAGLVLVARPATPEAAPAAAASCSVSMPSALAFGTYSVFSPTPTDSVATLTVQCSRVSWIYVTLAGGPMTDGHRALTGPGGSLAYNLYLDAARTDVWGDGTDGSAAVKLSFFLPISLTIYGRVFPQQDAAVGAYSDAIQAVVNF